VNTLNPTVQAEGAYAGSISGFSKMPFSGKLSLQDAIRRGLDYNLGTVGLNQAVRQSHGQTRVARSALLPNLTGDLAETVEQTSLAASGFNKFKISGFALPTVIGPFTTLICAPGFRKPLWISRHGKTLNQPMKTYVQTNSPIKIPAISSYWRSAALIFKCLPPMRESNRLRLSWTPQMLSINKHHSSGL